MPQYPTYDIEELRELTYTYFEDPRAQIPCPDCSRRPGLTIAEDQPAVAALLGYCPLCDGYKYVHKARALAVLPHIAAYIKALQLEVKELREQVETECQKA